MTLRIVTDATALLPDKDATRLAIEVVPVEVTLEGEQIGDLPTDAFYRRLRDGARATTSQPSPGSFAEAYERLAGDGATQIVSVHLDARLSGTLQAAELAARDAPVPVTVVDTGTVSFGVAVSARAAAEAVSFGADSAEAEAVARALAGSVRNVFVAADAPDGRLEAAEGWNVYELVDGAVRPLAASGSAAEAVDLMAELILDGAHVRAAVGHAAAETRRPADTLAAALGSLSVERYRVEPAVGAHSGGLTFGAFWWPVREP